MCKYGKYYAILVLFNTVQYSAIQSLVCLSLSRCHADVQVDVEQTASSEGEKVEETGGQAEAPAEEGGGTTEGEAEAEMAAEEADREEAMDDDDGGQPKVEEMETLSGMLMELLTTCIYIHVCMYA